MIWYILVFNVVWLYDEFCNTFISRNFTILCMYVFMYLLTVILVNIDRVHETCLHRPYWRYSDQKFPLPPRACWKETHINITSQSGWKWRESFYIALMSLFQMIYFNCNGAVAVSKATGMTRISLSHYARYLVLLFAKVYLWLLVSFPLHSIVFHEDIEKRHYLWYSQVDRNSIGFGDVWSRYQLRSVVSRHREWSGITPSAR